MKIHIWDHARYVKDRAHPYHECAAMLRHLMQHGISRSNIYLPEVPDLDAYCRAASEAGIAVEARIHPQAAMTEPPLWELSETQWEEMENRFGIRIAAPCPNHPAYREKLAAAAERLCAEYAGKLYGIQLDFIRGPNSLVASDFPCGCEACRELRKKYFGFELPPDEFLHHPAYVYRSSATLCANVRAAVAAVRRVTEKYHLSLSVAARTNYLNSPDIAEPPVWGLGPAVLEGQDWVEWAEDGLVDTVVTMNYHLDFDFFRRNLEDHLRLTADARAEFISGIGVESSMGINSPAGVERRLSLLAGLGQKSVYLFNKSNIYHQEYLKVIQNFS